jgi:cytochrome c biogenesis protein CcmG/thiol:disulfide interchange protein DsbE
MTEGFYEKEIQEERPRRWGVILIWVVIFGILIVLGLGLNRTKEGPVSIGEKVPDFVLTTFDGEQIDTEELRGKVIVINFWASWCKTCEQEAPELEQVYQSFRDDGVVFLGVDYVDTESEALAYLSKFNITYPNGPDLRTRISQAFRVRAVPETYIVSKDGILVDIKIGPYQSFTEIENAVINALSQ